MKRFDALIEMQKTSALCKVPFLKKKIIKTAKISFVKNAHFWGVILDFFKNGTLQRAEVSCVVINVDKNVFLTPPLGLETSGEKASW